MGGHKYGEIDPGLVFACAYPAARHANMYGPRLLAPGPVPLVACLRPSGLRYKTSIAYCAYYAIVIWLGVQAEPSMSNQLWRTLRTVIGVFIMVRWKGMMM